MAVKVWLSIQSDFGITMGELGSLASDTDSKLIASTLMALKDIVTVEASSGESQFMTGAVESSSFGTFAIPVNKETKLIMSYVVSAEQGSTIKDDTVDLVQAVCNNLGKQLTQFGQIADYALSGQGIHRSTLIQAFLNAITIVKFERNLPNDKRLAGKGMQTLVNDLLKDKERLLPLYDYTLGSNWKTDDTRWSQGVPLNSEKEKLIEGLATEVVYTLANERPLSFLYSPDPRNEHKRIYAMVENQITDKVRDSEDEIIKYMIQEIKEKSGKFIDTIPSVSLHASESLLFKEFSKLAFVDVVNDSPLQFFSTPDHQTIEKAFQKLIPTLHTENFGSILYHSIEKRIDKSSRNFVKSFFDGYIEGMQDITLSQPGVDLITAFSQEFIDGKKIADAVKANKSISKKRTSEITKLIKTKEITQLQVESIEEAVILTNAAGTAVVHVLAETIINQFLFPKEVNGMVINDFLNYYLESGPIIKSLFLLVGFLETLAETKKEPELVIPSFREILISSLAHNRFKIEVGEEEIVEMKLKGGRYVVEINGADESIYDRFRTSDTITLLEKNGNKMEIDFKNVDADVFFKLVTDPDVLINSVSIAAKSRLDGVLVNEIDLWISNIQKEMNKIAEEFRKGSKKVLSELTQVRPVLPRNQFQKVSLGVRVADELDDFGDAMQALWEKEVIGPWDQIIAEAKQKNEVPKNVHKKISKFSQNMSRSMEKLKKSPTSKFEDIVKDISKLMKSYKNKIKLAMFPDEDEILSYIYDSDHILPTREEVLDVLKAMIARQEGLRQEDFQQLILNVSLTLFENPPVSVFEPAYNEVISGKRSNSIKKVLNNVKSKKEFEKILKDQGQEFASKIYNGIEKIINRLNQLYIKKNGIVTSDGGHVYLHIGRLPIAKFPNVTLIEEILSFSNVHLQRETGNWLISYEMLKINQAQSKHPTIVTFEDAVRYLQQQRFEERLGSVFRAISKVTHMIEASAGVKVTETYNTLKNLIYAS